MIFEPGRLFTGNICRDCFTARRKKIKLILESRKQKNQYVIITQVFDSCRTLSVLQQGTFLGSRSTFKSPRLQYPHVNFNVYRLVSKTLSVCCRVEFRKYYARDCYYHRRTTVCSKYSTYMNVIGKLHYKLTHGYVHELVYCTVFGLNGL